MAIGNISLVALAYSCADEFILHTDLNTIIFGKMNKIAGALCLDI